MSYLSFVYDEYRLILFFIYSINVCIKIKKSKKLNLVGSLVTSVVSCFGGRILLALLVGESTGLKGIFRDDLKILICLFSYAVVELVDLNFIVGLLGFINTYKTCFDVLRGISGYREVERHSFFYIFIVGVLNGTILFFWCSFIGWGGSLLFPYLIGEGGYNELTSEKTSSGFKSVLLSSFLLTLLHSPSLDQPSNYQVQLIREWAELISIVIGFSFYAYSLISNKPEGAKADMKNENKRRSSSKKEK
jgi:hypothetical protein